MRLVYHRTAGAHDCHLSNAAPLVILGASYVSREDSLSAAGKLPELASPNKSPRAELARLVAASLPALAALRLCRSCILPRSSAPTSPSSSL
jgi:hypothetical protein